MQSLRILHFLGIGAVPKRPLVDATGGTERVVLETARRQVAQGHAVTIASIGKKNWMGSWQGVELLRLTPYRWARLRIGARSWDLTDQLRLARLVRQRKFDIVHLHQHLRTRLLPAERTFVQFHNCPLPSPDAESFKANAPRYWKGISRSVAQIGVSDFVGRRLLAVHEAAGAPGPHAITVNQSGVDLAFFDRDAVQAARSELRGRLGLTDRDTLFMFAGALRAEKGVDVLARAFMRLSAQHADAHLAIVGGNRLWSKPGSGVDESLEAFEGGVWRLLDPALQQKRVFPMGIVSPLNILPAYAAADVFVLPSAFQETFGLVILEAFARGIPVIASVSGGIPELVKDRRNGLLFEIGDEEALFRAMRELLVDKDLRAGFAREALQTASGFSWDNTVERLGMIYRKARHGEAAA